MKLLRTNPNVTSLRGRLSDGCDKTNLGLYLDIQKLDNGSELVALEVVLVVEVSKTTGIKYLTYLFDDLTSRWVACLTTIHWHAAYRGPLHRVLRASHSSRRLTPVEATHARS